jgi:hypothetical protein
MLSHILSSRAFGLLFMLKLDILGDVMLCLSVEQYGEEFLLMH